MPSLEEAREQAWRKLSSTHPLGTAIPWADGFDLGYKAGRAEDEQRIAALVDKVTMTAEAMEEEAAARADGDSELVLRTFANMLRRALAGQKEALPAERAQERVE